MSIYEKEKARNAPVAVPCMVPNMERIPTSGKMERWGIRFTGIVQGVGFRPLVSVLAHRYDLTGFVYNDTQGVYTEIQGYTKNLASFLEAMKTELPPLARIDRQTTWQCALRPEERAFTIRTSDAAGTVQTMISPDTAVCEDCLREMNNPTDRRFHYGFINCTHCGPRYSIIESIPYDRKHTSMADFPMCASCAKEYEDIQGRRYHAEPNACPVCGPQYHLYTASGEDAMPVVDGGTSLTEAMYAKVRTLIEEGAIIAMKGIGGYHLVCDATQPAVVQRLRDRKLRPKKPLAIMAGSLQRLRMVADISEAEEKMLTSMARPIVILHRHKTSESVADLAWKEVSPDHHTVGAMLPYAPIHHALLPADALWVMTSGNVSGDAILFDDEEAKEVLAPLVDYFFVHNRKIVAPVDDSVVACVEDHPMLYRRSRGYAPLSLPVGLKHRSDHQLLALGGDLKNAIALQRDEHVFLSPYLGDVGTPTVLQRMEDTIHRYESLFDLSPTAVVTDLHPNYASTQWGKVYAEEKQLPLLQVQHHHAHVASVLAEHEWGDTPVLGICFDGTGYGTDGTIWGGEFLLCQGSSFKRLAHVMYAPLLGGDIAVKEPWRQGLWWLRHIFGDDVPTRYETWMQGLPEGWELLDQAIRNGVPFPQASSAGRLFDAVGSLLGLGYVHSYEGHIAMALEQLADGEKGHLHDFNFEGNVLDMSPLLQVLLERYANGVSRHMLAASFHRTLAYGVSEVAEHLCRIHGCRHVVLCGGVFQNRRFVQDIQHLWQDHMTLLLPSRIPINDGGIALGQIWIAQQRLLEQS